MVFGPGSDYDPAAAGELADAARREVAEPVLRSKFRPRRVWRAGG